MKRKRLVFICLLFMMFTLLTLFLVSGKLVGFETWIYNKSVGHMSPVLTGILKFITNMGGVIAVIVFCLVLLIIPKTRRKWGYLISITVSISAILNIVLKQIFARERPNILRIINESDYSFPSGHSMINAAFYVMIILLTHKYIKNKVLEYSIMVFSALMILIVGFSRIYLGVHYAGDVIGGFILGSLISIIIYSIEFYEKRKS